MKRNLRMRRRAWAAVLGMLAAALAFPPGLRAGEIFRDDFSHLPPGWLSYPVGELNGAIQEYHYLKNRGVDVRPWVNPITYLDSWVAGDEGGQPYLEQHLINNLPQLMSPLFVTGEPEWGDYTVEAEVRPLSKAEMAGVVFRYHTSRHHYLFALTGGTQARLVLRLPVETEFRHAQMRELGRAEFPYDVKRYYRLRVENDGPRIRCYIDGKLVIEGSSDDLPLGRVGVAANIPARFRNFRVTASDAAEARIRERVTRREVELNALRAAQPHPKLWKRFKTPLFGAGRNARFGDLDGDGQLDMLIAQNVPKVRGDAFDHISCLTALTLDGKVLWQIGRPDPRNGLLTNDTPFQIHDLDGDGRNEVVLVKDFKLQVLDGATGKLKQSTWMPEAPVSNKERPYELNNGDSIAFFNLSGKPGRREILIKDRYRGFWMFDNDLRLLWKGEGQTGHYPFPFDYDNDGRDEITIGYSVRDTSGNPLWSHDSEMRDHPDAISAGNYTGDPSKPPRAYFCSSDEGFLIVRADGKIVNHIRIGHAQTQSVGQFRPATGALEILVANFWKNPGIITMFDPDGNILAQDEMVPGSTHLASVNWRGDGQEFALLSGNVEEGGMIDGQLRRVVMFPDDGHPDLAYAVRNVTGDERDEVILWDQQEVWVYTQDRPFEGSRVYAPTRNPDYNESNYRATVSLPGWKQLGAARGVR